MEVTLHELSFLKIMIDSSIAPRVMIVENKLQEDFILHRFPCKDITHRNRYIFLESQTAIMQIRIPDFKKRDGLTYR